MKTVNLTRALLVVAVNGLDAARPGAHFHKQVAVDNTNGPAYALIEIFAGNANLEPL